MFIKLTDGRKLNLYWLSDVFLGKHDTKLLIFYMVNGSKLFEAYATQEEAEKRLEEVKEAMDAARGGGLIQRDTFDDFPEKGNKGFVYLAKDTGQTYYWDEITKEYVKTGIAGRTGVYSTDNKLPETVGEAIVLKKSELEEILKPSVPFQEGSEVIGNNSVHGIITKVDGDNVTIQTITDLVIDSFRQVKTEADLPTTGTANILYYVDDIDEFRIWDVDTNTWQEPFHPIIYNSNTTVADARPKVIYINGSTAKYTLDNQTWIYLTNPDEELVSSLEFDGINTQFDLPTDLTDKEFAVYINGLRNFEGDDYTIDRTVTPNTIDFDIVYDTFDVCKLVYINEILT